METRYNAIFKRLRKHSLLGAFDDIRTSCRHRVFLNFRELCPVPYACRKRSLVIRLYICVTVLCLCRRAVQLAAVQLRELSLVPSCLCC